MSGTMIEHRGVVQRLEGGMAIVVMDTAGCSSCGQGGSCGIGKLASGRAATLLSLPAGAGVKVGDRVGIALPEGSLTLGALFGYLFPAFAMLLGAWGGAALDGSDGASALGALGGFLSALVIARFAIGRIPGLLPRPRLIPLAWPSRPVHRSDLSHLSPQELHHEH